MREVGETKAGKSQTLVCIPEYGVDPQVRTYGNKQGRGSRWDWDQQQGRNWAESLPQGY